MVQMYMYQFTKIGHKFGSDKFLSGPLIILILDVE